MDFGLAFSYVFEDEDWVKKLATGQRFVFNCDWDYPRPRLGT